MERRCDRGGKRKRLDFIHTATSSSYDQTRRSSLAQGGEGGACSFAGGLFALLGSSSRSAVVSWWPAWTQRPICSQTGKVYTAQILYCSGGPTRMVVSFAQARARLPPYLRHSWSLIVAVRSMCVYRRTLVRATSFRTEQRQSIAHVFDGYL